MIPIVRKGKIKKMLLENKIVTVINLSEILSVSEETIRRDLKLLEEEGIAVRTHGGAVLSEKVSSRITDEDLKEVFIESKEKMASRVMHFISNGDSIYLDSSTTAYYLAKAIKEKRLTVATNSLNIINLLSKYPGINLIVIGGTLSKNRQCFIGRHAINMINEYFFDMCFISGRTISMDIGLTDSNDDEAEVKRVVATRSKQTFFLADHSKFDKVSLTKIIDFDKVDYLVTDKILNDKWKEYLKNINVKYIDDDIVESNELD